MRIMIMSGVPLVPPIHPKQIRSWSVPVEKLGSFLILTALPEYKAHTFQFQFVQWGKSCKTIVFLWCASGESPTSPCLGNRISIHIGLYNQSMLHTSAAWHFRCMWADESCRKQGTRLAEELSLHASGCCRNCLVRTCRMEFPSGIKRTWPWLKFRDDF